MPTFVVPRKSGVHRIAAIALYRALLSQCKALSLPETQHHELLHLVRNRFKQAQHVHSYRRLRFSFEAGFQAIDHLDNAVAGDSESKSYILSLLAKAPARVKLPPPKPTPNPPKPTTPPHSILDRPLPLSQLTGPRHVPILFSANNIPVLRIKKPQPESLSRYLHKRILQRQKWHDQRQKLVEELTLATQEDDWDDILGDRGPRVVKRREPDWEDGVVGALEEVCGKLKREKLRNRLMAEKMQGVVDREQELFDREKRKRVELKRRKQAGQDMGSGQDVGSRQEAVYKPMGSMPPGNGDEAQ